MHIGGAEFVMGVSQETDDMDDYSMALKIIVYGMDNNDTVNKVFEALSQALLTLDPQLELAEIKGDKSHIN
tara:strand:- start:663 stop:875 length:213 start_codon:yes stop_codon:yes gene_type:complete